MSPVTAPPPSLADRIEDLLPQTQCTKCGYPACRPYAEAIADGTASYDQCPPGGAEGIARLAALLGEPVIPLNVEHGVERPRPVARIDESLCIGCTLCIQACPVDAIVGAAKRMHTIIESMCTGCDLCVAPCPVDCIDMIPVTGDATGWDAWSQAQADDARARHDRHLERERRDREAAERRIAERQAAHKEHLAHHSAAAASSTPGATLGSTPGTTPGTTPSSTHDPAPGLASSDQAHVIGNATIASSRGPAMPHEPSSIERSAEAREAGGLPNAGTTPSGTATTGASSDSMSPDERKKAIIAAALERARQKKAELAQHGQGPKNTEHVSAAVQAQIDEADARRKRLGIDEDPS